MEKMKEFKFKNDPTPTERANNYAVECKMSESEWENFNNCLYGNDFDEHTLVKTLSDVKAILPFIPMGGGTYGSTFVPDEPELFNHTFEVSEHTLRNWCFYEINKENYNLPERTPENIRELVNWTSGMFNKWHTNISIEFAVWMNQHNDKFMCLVRLWYKFREFFSE